MTLHYLGIKIICHYKSYIGSLKRKVSSLKTIVNLRKSIKINPQLFSQFTNNTCLLNIIREIQHLEAFEWSCHLGDTTFRDGVHIIPLTG